MAIKMIPDLGAPLTVAVVNIAGRTAFPTYHDWVVYAMTILGYVGGWMNWGGDFVKQIGVSSLPLTADKLYTRFSGGAASRASQSMSFRRAAVSRYPAPAQEAPFQGVRLV